jgi:CubicO group peptidase (beta-lactamase class C family)
MTSGPVTQRQGLSVAALVTVYLIGLVTAARGQSLASFEWTAAAPESQGLSAAKLALLKDKIAGHTKALLVIRNDKIAYEWYAEGRTSKDKHYTASMAKAIVGGLSLAVAVNDGLISTDDQAAKYVPQWKDHPLKSQITIRHLGSHTSGIKDSQNPEERARGIDQKDFTGWEGEFWRWRARSQPSPNDAFSISRDVAPMLFAPGKEFHYSNPGIAMLTYCVTASLKRRPHADIRTLLRERIMRPIGVAEDDWNCGYGKTEIVEGLPRLASWGGGNFTPRATARIGRLMLRKGDWDGQRLLSESAVEAITSHGGLPGHCGMGFWTNAADRYPGFPRDAFWGSGAGHQVVLVIPSLKLVMVRNGDALPADPNVPDKDDARYQEPLFALLFKPLLDAVQP